MHHLLKIFVLALGLAGASASAMDKAEERFYRVKVLTDPAKASQSTRDYNEAVFFLDRADMARLGDASIVRKAQVEKRRAVYAKLAEKDSAYAQWLLGLRPGGKDDMVLIEKAANQGLIRAIALRAVVLAQKGGPDRDKHLQVLQQMGDLGSGYAMYMYWMVTGAKDTGASGDALIKANSLGFAPAQVFIAQVYAKGKDPKHWETGRKLAEIAAKAGDEEAKALLDAYPPKPSP